MVERAQRAAGSRPPSLPAAALQNPFELSKNPPRPPFPFFAAPPSAPACPCCCGCFPSAPSLQLRERRYALRRADGRDPISASETRATRAALFSRQGRVLGAAPVAARRGVAVHSWERRQRREGEGERRRQEAAQLHRGLLLASCGGGRVSGRDLTSSARNIQARTGQRGSHRERADLRLRRTSDELLELSLEDFHDAVLAL